MIPNQITYCLIWGKDYRATGDSKAINSTSFVRSDRTDGAYQITWEALDFVNERDDPWKARLTTWLIDQRAQGDEAPMITTRIVEYIDEQRPLPVRERIVRLLRCIASLGDTVGDEVTIRPNSSNGNAALAWSESTDYMKEVFKFLIQLERNGWLEGGLAFGGVFAGTVAIEGHIQIEEQETNSNSSRASITNTRNRQTQEYQYDFFIAHASEDKEGFVRKLAETLRTTGAKVWYDEFTLKVGDNLRQEIELGLANSRFGIVVLSKHFFEKEWTKQELDGLWSLDLGGATRILPIWYEISKEEVSSHYPMLVNRVALETSQESIANIADKLVERLGRSEH